MTTHSATLLIGQSPEVVWDILADLETWPSWTPTMTSVKLLGTGGVGPGTQARILQPKLQPAIWVVTEWRPGRSFAWETRVMGSKIVADHVLDAVDGQCRFTQSVQYQGWVGALLSALTGSLTQEYMQIEAQGLKRLAESRQQRC